MTSSLSQLTIKEAQEGLKEKKFSSVELTGACLNQIEKHNPDINAFLTINEQALDQAKEADEERENASNLPLL